MLILELLYVRSGRLAREVGLLVDDGKEHRIDVLCHTGGVAANVDAGSLLEPCVKRGGLLEHAVLYVDLSVLVAREGEVEAGEGGGRLDGGKVFGVEGSGGCGSLSEREAIVGGVAGGG